MAGCCSGARSVVIEATVLRVDGETCERCSGTIEAVRQAARDLEAELVPFNVRVSLLEHATDAANLADSNVVIINGRSVEDWLGGDRLSTDCPSCGDLVGDSVCCSAVEIGGQVHESLTAEQVRDAALAALGLGATRECGCS